MLDAFYQSLVIFFVATAAYADTEVDMWEFGTTITTSCLITMLLHGAIEIRSWVKRDICKLILFNQYSYMYFRSDYSAYRFYDCQFGIILCIRIDI